MIVVAEKGSYLCHFLAKIDVQVRFGDLFKVTRAEATKVTSSMGDVGGVDISSKRPFIVSKFFSMKSFMGHIKGSFSPKVRKLAKFWTLFAINIKSRATLQDACSVRS